MSFEKVGEKANDSLPVYDDLQRVRRPPSLAPSYRSVWSLRSLKPRSIAPSYHTVDQWEPRDKSESDLDVINEEDAPAAPGLVRTLSSALNFQERRRQRRLFEAAIESQSKLLRCIDQHRNFELEVLLELGQDANEPLYSGRAIPTLSKKKEKATLPVFLDYPAKNRKTKGKNKVVVSISKRDVAGDPPLYRAVFKENTKAVELLLKHGANVHGRDYLGETALTRAVREGYVEITKMLLAGGADVNELEHFDATPLMNAAICRRPEMIKVLLEAGADVSAQDAGGRTALMNAASSDCPGIVKLLLDNGADPGALTREGHTALDAAILILFARGLERNGVTDLLIAARDGRPIEEVMKRPVKIDALSGYAKRQFTNMDIEFSVTSDGMEKNTCNQESMI